MSKVTKRALEQSLKNLLLKKPLTKITIGDITEDCGINRMTFTITSKIFTILWNGRAWRMHGVRWMRKRLMTPGSRDFLQIFAAVQENKPFILNVYRCVHREQVEKYLQPLVDQLLLDVIEEESSGMMIREEDKQFIAKVYAYIFIGIMLDWIKDDMRNRRRKL